MNINHSKHKLKRFPKKKKKTFQHKQLQTTFNDDSLTDIKHKPFISKQNAFITKVLFNSKRLINTIQTNYLKHYYINKAKYNKNQQQTISDIDNGNNNKSKVKYNEENMSIEIIRTNKELCNKSQQCDDDDNYYESEEEYVNNDKYIEEVIEEEEGEINEKDKDISENVSEDENEEHSYDVNYYDSKVNLIKVRNYNFAKEDNNNNNNNNTNNTNNTASPPILPQNKRTNFLKQTQATQIKLRDHTTIYDSNFD